MNTYFKTQVLQTPHEAAARLAVDFIRFSEEMLRYRDTLYIALSGGSTPQLMFDILSKEYPTAVKWGKLHFFWVDERCVLSDSAESNYGNAHRLLFSKVRIPTVNVHAVHGGDDPLTEVVRYTGEILSHVPCSHNIPIFDLILLGMGDDGHTASIFPGQTDLFETNAICSISLHPKTCQKRITLTGKVINNAAEVVFLVTGENKAETLNAILNQKNGILPAQKIKPVNGKLAWYLDKEAALLIDSL